MDRWERWEDIRTGVITIRSSGPGWHFELACDPFGGEVDPVARTVRGFSESDLESLPGRIDRLVMKHSLTDRR